MNICLILRAEVRPQASPFENTTVAITTTNRESHASPQREEDETSSPQDPIKTVLNPPSLPNRYHAKSSPAYQGERLFTPSKTRLTKSLTVGSCPCRSTETPTSSPVYHKDSILILKSTKSSIKRLQQIMTSTTTSDVKSLALTELSRQLIQIRKQMLRISTTTIVLSNSN